MSDDPAYKIRYEHLLEWSRTYRALDPSQVCSVNKVWPKLLDKLRSVPPVHRWRHVRGPNR
eukprot:295214-Pyramimonas_sp.AAC.1